MFVFTYSWSILYLEKAMCKDKIYDKLKKKKKKKKKRKKRKEKVSHYNLVATDRGGIEIIQIELTERNGWGVF